MIDREAGYSRRVVCGAVGALVSLTGCSLDTGEASQDGQPDPPRLDDLEWLEGPHEYGGRIRLLLTDTSGQDRKVYPPIYFYNVDKETVIRQVPFIDMNAGETREWEMGFIFGDNMEPKFSPSVGDTLLTAVGERQQLVEVQEVTESAE